MSSGRVVGNGIDLGRKAPSLSVDSQQSKSRYGKNARPHSNVRGDHSSKSVEPKPSTPQSYCRVEWFYPSNFPARFSLREIHTGVNVNFLFVTSNFASWFGNPADCKGVQSG